MGHWIQILQNYWELRSPRLHIIFDGGWAIRETHDWLIYSLLNHNSKVVRNTEWIRFSNMFIFSWINELINESSVCFQPPLKMRINFQVFLELVHLAFLTTYLIVVLVLTIISAFHFEQKMTYQKRMHPFSMAGDLF